MNYFLGTYIVDGTNQDKERSKYQGVLELSSYNQKDISAKWTIGELQEQFGKGYIKDNKLMVDFHYYDDLLIKCKGQISYSFIDNQVLKGVWTEENGDKYFKGLENCFRINDDLEH